MSVLQVQGVTKEFGKLVAVNGVSLAVEPGELRAVIGPNGAGKTTFFNLISGFFPPTAGKILFDGRDITAMPEHARVGLGMARTFQVTEIFPELTVRENLRVPVEVAAGKRLSPWMSKADKAKASARIEAALWFVVTSMPSLALIVGLSGASSRPCLPPPPKPRAPISSERRHFCMDSLKVRPMAMASPTDFIAEVSVVLAPGNFSKVKRGILVTT